MIQDVPDSQNINPSMIQNNQNNQFLSQVNDPGLIDVTQKIIQVSKEKYLEEEEKKADEEEAREQEEGPKKSILSKSMIQRRLNFKKLNEEFKNIFNKDNSNINDIRRCLIHVIILVGVMNCCVWEVDCLFFNICYGENIEMDQRISALLFPLIILSIFILYILFVSINYLQRKIIMTCIIIYILLSIVLFIIGILSIVKGVKFNSEDEENAYETLTQFEKDYYDEKGLRKEYRRKMLASGIMNIILSVFGFFVSFKTFLFKSLLTKTSFDWRPPLRSHVRAQRIKKTVQLYTNNYDSYLYKFQAENPNYQIDEVEAKENKNRFGGIKNSILNKSRAGGESEKKDKKEKESEKSSDIPLPKKKKKSEKSENSNDNNDEDDIPLPRLKKKKKVLLNRIGEQNNEKDKHEENNNKSDEEHSNNINNNNHVNNNHIIEEEINTDIKKDIKEDDV